MKGEPLARILGGTVETMPTRLETTGRALLGIVVVGLPRCGSSAIMAMLQAGGVDVWADPDTGKRLELWRARQEHPLDWLPDLGERAVKVLAPPAFYLPRGIDQRRMILLTRDLADQVESADTGLRVLYELEATDPMRLGLAAGYRAMHPRMMRRWPDALQINFRELIREPERTAARVAHRFGLASTNLEAMAATIWKRPPYHTGVMLDAWGD